MQSHLDKIHREFIGALRVRPPSLAADWADNHRILSVASSSEPGLWSTDRTPYIREILNATSSVPPYNKIRRIIVMKGHQIGYTEGVLMNTVGHVIAEAPCPMMIVCPTEKAAKKMLQQKLEPMMHDTPLVRAKISKFSRMTQRNTLIHKDFAGGFVVLSGAGVAADLAGTSVKMLLLDEVDRMTLDVQGEGSPVELAIGRTAAYNRRKIVMGSTPVDEETSVIMRYFRQGDQRYYFIPCPHCGHMQTLRMENLRWPEGDPGLAHYICEKCNEPIEEKHKTLFLEKGKWKPTHENNDPTTISFHLNSLYSPVGFLSWADVARAKLRADQDEMYKQTFQNLFLGLPSTQMQDEVPSPRVLFQNKEPYSLGSLPKDSPKKLLITGGVDVQADRIEATLYAWHRKRGYLLEYQTFWGDTNVDPWQGPWGEITDFLHGKHAGRHIHLLGVDGGYMPHRIFAWRNYIGKPRTVRVVRGYGDMPGVISIYKHMEVTEYTGRKTKKGNRYQHVNGHFLKGEIYKRLLRSKPADDYISFPEDLPREFFEQLVAERCVLSDKKDLMDRTTEHRYKWRAVRQRNEALDMTVYALAMWYASGAPRYTKEGSPWENLIKHRDVFIG